MLTRDAIKFAEMARDAGFPLAGDIEDLYEGARIFLPPMFLHDLEENTVFRSTPILIGEIIHIHSVSPQYDHPEDFDNDPFYDDGIPERFTRRPHFVVGFVVERDSDRLQVPLSFGKGHPVFFALPETQ
jgi:hypothetical protein